MSTKSLIVVGNGFIGNYVSWRSRSSRTFTLTREYASEIEHIPVNDEYIVVWAHGESRGADMRSSQIDTLRACGDALRKAGLDIRGHIYISSTKVHEYPISDFAAVKLECEIFARSLHQSSHILRVPNVYGVFSQPRANSVLSTWILESSDIRANSDTREYIPLESLNRFIEDCVSKVRLPGTYTLRGEPCTMSDVGARLSQIRGVPFCAIDGSTPVDIREAVRTSGSVEIPAPDDLDLVGSMGSLHKASRYARDLQDRVQTSARYHRRQGTQHYLQDLDAGVFENMQRVYTFNVLPGCRRGGHYHIDQTEVFYIAQGVGELLLESEKGSGVVTLRPGQHIRVNPMEQHTFRSRTSELTVVAVSDLAYIPNSVPDTYVYTEKELTYAP